MKSALFCFILLFSNCASGRAERIISADPFPVEIEHDLSAGTTAIYHLDFISAEKHFQRAIQIRSEHPAAYFFLLMLHWYELTYDSLANRKPDLEKIILSQSDLTAEKAKAFTRHRQTEAVGYLYWGGALGARGWYHVCRNQWVRAYFAGKKGYGYALKAVELYPELYDAYLGLGMYEYYAATLGPTLRALASFSVRGDKAEALNYLHRAETQSRYVRLETSYFLWNAALEENRYSDAGAKAKEMRQIFPDSPLFHWCEIQTLYAEQKWAEVIKCGEDFIQAANGAPQPEFYVSPYEKLLSKVLYHCGTSAYQMNNLKLAKHYFDRAIDQKVDFEGWKVMAYLRRGEIFDLEGKRIDALAKYRAVLAYSEYWNSHKSAKARIKRPFTFELYHEMLEKKSSSWVDEIR